MSADNQWFNSYELHSDSYRGPGGLGVINGTNPIFSLNNELNHLRAYNECPPLKSIVAKRAKAFNVGLMDVYNTNTGKPAPKGAEAQSYRNIIKRPNPLQTQKQFFAQQNIYIDIFGYCPILIVRPFGVNDALTAIWNIPPWLFNITFTGLWLQQNDVTGIFKGYSLSWSTGAITLEPENLKILFDDGFGTDMDINLTIPDSRLRGQDLPVCNIIAALRARNTLITRRGATGILSNMGKDAMGMVPMADGDKKAVQEDFARYGIVGQEFQVIISESSLQWQQMGFATKDLMLFEEIEDDVNMLCDAYGYYPELLARSKGVTFDNKEKAQKMLYTETIIPESQSRLEQFSNAVIGQNNVLIFQSSFSHVPALQAEALQKAQARKELDTALEKEFKNNILTLDEWRDAICMQLIGGEFGGKYYYELIELGWQFGNTTVTGGDNQPTTPPADEATQTEAQQAA